jgi:hypothetical protein
MTDANINNAEDPDYVMGDEHDPDSDASGSYADLGCDEDLDLEEGEAEDIVEQQSQYLLEDEQADEAVRSAKRADRRARFINEQVKNHNYNFDYITTF